MGYFYYDDDDILYVLLYRAFLRDWRIRWVALFLNFVSSVEYCG